MNQHKLSTTDWLFQEILNRIRTGVWPIGSSIPSERRLIEEFGVSRIALRESLSRLRALGILHIAHGRQTTVQPVDMKIIGQLFPFMLAGQSDYSFEQIFEVRLAIESRTAYLAALLRRPEDLKLLEERLAAYRDQLDNDLEKMVQRDLDFHLQIARASQNNYFPILLEVISGFVTYVQSVSCLNNPAKRQRAMEYHESILEAIRSQDAERARVEMVSHLHYSADDILKNGKSPVAE